MNNNLQKAREFFIKDRYATNSRICIEEVEEDYVICSLKIEDMHKNASGGAHGGAIFTLSDLAFAVNANISRVDDSDYAPTLLQSASISFLKGTRGNILYAKSRCVSKGRRISVYSINVYDDLGVDIAQVIMNGFTKTA